MSNPATLRVSKRKRGVVSYSEQQDDDDLLDERDIDVSPPISGAAESKEVEDSDEDFGTKKKPRKFTKKATKKASRNQISKPPKPFPFMKLPGELRNEIYKVALVRHDGLRLEAAVRKRGQPRRRISLMLDHINEKRSTKILRLSKQIYAEAAPFLYGQMITLKDNVALSCFLLKLRPQTKQMLENLRLGVAGSLWRRSGGVSMQNVAPAAFAQLCDAVNLRKFGFVGRGIYQYPSSREPHPSTSIDQLAQLVGERFAQNMYGDCHPWLEAVIHSPGGKAKLGEILEIPDTNFEPQSHWYHTAHWDAQWTSAHIAKARKAMLDEIQRLVEEDV